jgi:hypothetical protein
MKGNSSFAKVVYVLALIATIIGFTAFSQKPPDQNSFKKEQLSKDNDTTKNSKRNKNEAVKGFDQLDIELKQLDMHLDQLNDELRNVDFSEVQRHLNEAMKKLDEQKISEKINQSLKKIDWNKMDHELNESLAKIDKVKFLEVKKEIEKAKAQIEKQKLNMRFDVPDIDEKKLRLGTEKAMKKARLSIQNAKEEMKNMQAFINALQADGLIDKSKAYKIEVKEGELYINGKKQSNEVSEKYKKYYKQKNFTININEDNIIRI